MNPNSTFVIVRDIKMNFGENQVLKGLNIEVKEGEFVTLLGPSGCGKTTLLRILAGFIKPTSGHIIIRGKEVTNLPAYKRGLGMVFQNYALWPHMTVAQHVSFGLKLAKLDAGTIAKRSEWALGLVGLAGFENRVPSELSGGQQQRVALARAISLQPTILLLDEPLSNLDRKLRDEMRIELRQLQQRLGITTVYVTHDQQEAINMSDRVIVLKNGAIQQEASPRVLFENPATPFVARFLGASNLIPVAIKKVEDKKAWIHFDDVDLVVPINNERVDYKTGFLVLRPEYLGFSTENTDRNSVLTGRIISAVYEGFGVRYEIAVEHTDKEITMLATGHEELPVGRKVDITVLHCSLVSSEENINDMSLSCS